MNKKESNDLLDKVNALGISINERLFEQLKDYYLAKFSGRYSSLEEFIKDHPYPTDQ